MYDIFILNTNINYQNVKKIKEIYPLAQIPKNGSDKKYEQFIWVLKNMTKDTLILTSDVDVSKLPINIKDDKDLVFLSSYSPYNIYLTKEKSDQILSSLNGKKLTDSLNSLKTDTNQSNSVTKVKKEGLLSILWFIIIVVFIIIITSIALKTFRPDTE